MNFSPRAVMEAVIDPRKLECFQRANIRFVGLPESRWQELDKQAGKRVEITHGHDRATDAHLIFTRLFKAKL